MTIDLKKGVKIGAIAVLVFAAGFAVLAGISRFVINTSMSSGAGYGPSTAGYGGYGMDGDLGIGYAENLGLGGGPSGVAKVMDMVRSGSDEQALPSNTVRRTGQEGTLTMKKIVKNGSLTLYVKDADKASADIRTLAEGMGGFVADSRIYKSTDGIKRGSIVIRVPADRFEEAMRGTKSIAADVDNETVTAEDVTERYQDLEIQIRNKEAEEARYLELMARTGTMSDTLQVANRLSDVRGEIEQKKGQLQFLSRQVDMSTISVNLSADADIEVFGLRWRPLVVAKQAMKRMFSGLTGYADAMIGLVFALPVIILWLATILGLAWAAFRVVRWLYYKAVKKGPEIKLS